MLQFNKEQADLLQKAKIQKSMGNQAKKMKKEL